LIHRHFDDCNLTDDATGVLKVLSKGRIPLLIDGFDEIGAQAWSNDIATLRASRRQSLAGVKDLLSHSPAGALITGREHYFNSQDELFECLGLDPDNTILLECNDEFTEPEMATYLNEISVDVSLPEWLPRRPLIAQILSGLGVEALEGVLQSRTGEVDCWGMLLNAVCDREATINAILDAPTIKNVLIRLARLTRQKPRDIGPLTIAEINGAFEDVTDVPPVDESAVILQRLPFLGRVSSGSPDREFVDVYFLNGLRAEDVCKCVYVGEENVEDEPWMNPLNPFGIRLIEGEMMLADNLNGFVRLMNRCATHRNPVLAGELLAAILLATAGEFDFKMRLSDAMISRLDFRESVAENLTISDSVIEEIDITLAQPKNLVIEKCTIGRVEGVAGEAGLPPWIRECKVSTFQTLSTLARIKAAPLNSAQRIFIAVVKKTFFQPGAGRKEEALSRGFGQSADKKLLRKILNVLKTESILTEVPGAGGALFVPQRKYTKRMGEIMQRLTLSDDPLWLTISDY
jgi:hypothetical protein